jgi:hypothetical protein
MSLESLHEIPINHIDGLISAVLRTTTNQEWEVAVKHKVSDMPISPNYINGYQIDITVTSRLKDDYHNPHTTMYRTIWVDKGDLTPK